MKTLNEYQIQCVENSTHDFETHKHFCLEYMTLALCGEAGELANLVKKEWRNSGSVTRQFDYPEEREKIIDELGDVLWYVAGVATMLGVNLGDVAYQNIDKLKDRNRRSGEMVATLDLKSNAPQERTGSTPVSGTTLTVNEI